MGESIKKYWFVALVAVLFCAAIGFFVLNDTSTADEFKGKSVDGKDVVFEYNGEAVTADDLYDEMFDEYSADLAYNFVQVATIRNAFEPDEDLLSEAKLTYDSYVSYYKSYYGEDYSTYILPSLKALGYTSVEDLEDLIVTQLMLQQLYKDYVNANIDTLFTEFQAAKSPRIISHILVAMDDPDNPTDEEKAKMAEIDAALANGDSFATVAENYSDDSTASSGGSFGYADLDTSLDTDFAAAAFALAEGETSGWVKSQYGYHLIKIDSVQLADLLEQDDFYTAIIDYYSLSNTVIWEAYQQRTVDYHDNTDLETQVLEALQSGVQEAAQ
ncbi:MAG: peptidylprolyl isomerase [Erysipelotrichaceae bacterium]|nr:peptidylprolyl isomerase [Erysipelotrichaceae bacterium]